jgi:hypothetical protein
METQNITVSLPKMLLRRAQLLAAERQTTLSSLLEEMLAKIVDQDDQDDRHEKAKQRQLVWLRQGVDLGTQGKITWTREELHER